MSVIAFATQMKAREDTTPEQINASKDTPNGTKDYLIVLAGLVPAEALALHAIAIAVATGKSADGKQTVITDPSALKWTFWGLIALTMFLYASVHLKTWDRYDWARVLIPPASFVAWSMLQSPSAFDAAVGDRVSAGGRPLIAAFAAVVLAVLAQKLVGTADRTGAKPQAWLARPSRVG